MNDMYWNTNNAANGGAGAGTGLGASTASPNATAGGGLGARLNIPNAYGGGNAFRGNGQNPTGRPMGIAPWVWQLMQAQGQGNSTAASAVNQMGQQNGGWDTNTLLAYLNSMR